MKALTSRFLLFSALLFLLGLQVQAQSLVGIDGASFDYTQPKEYEIGGIMVTGAQYLDAGAVINITGLTVGEKITVPGDEISKAIEKLWKQGLFSDLKITSSKILSNQPLGQPDVIFLNIVATEKPRLSRFSFRGVGKSEADDLKEKINLVKGKPVTDNLKTNANNTIREYFIDKGFLNVQVNIKEERDTMLANSVMLSIQIDKKEKIRINRIYIHGNTELSSGMLRRSLSDTKERNRIELFRDIYSTLTDSIGKVSLKKFIAAFGNPKKLYDYASPRLRLAIFSSSKFIDNTYQTDKQAIVSKYAEAGFRDARIAKDSIYRFDEKSINIDITVDEGEKYYFRNITWVGNTKHTAEELSNLLSIKKGDIFNQSALDSRLYMNPDGRDVSSLYLDDGYLFFSVTPVEINVEQDSIDLEMRIYEGKQATINKVYITGNNKTNDRVAMREIRTKPGQLFSRSDIIRSQRELSQLGYFDPEKLNVNPKPNPAEGTVDIEYIVEEKASDQVELSGGWGAGQLVGTLGVSFNNFSGRNIFNKESWAPLPSGDGQKLSVRGQTNGKYFQSYNVSFTEPWLGGKKPNSMSVSAFSSTNSNGVSKSDESLTRSAVSITGASIGFGARLKFPDDYFSRYLDFSYQYYELQNYTNFVFSDGYANNLKASLTISRNSIDQPIYPRTGSQISGTLEATPPYSLFKKDVDYTTISQQEKYKFVEAHKWKFSASWFQRLAGNLVLNSRMKFGYLGRYNNKLGNSPFDRFYMGGDGLSGFQLDGREIIALRGYQNNYLTPRGITSQGTYSYVGGTVYDKCVMELRYPISLNPSATIYVLGFAEAGNTWLKFSQFNPFNLRRSAGLGVRIFLPMFGQLGLDYGWGFDQGVPSNPNIAPKGQFHFSIGQSIE